MYGNMYLYTHFIYINIVHKVYQTIYPNEILYNLIQFLTKVGSTQMSAMNAYELQTK